VAVRVGDLGTAMTALRPQGLVRIAGDRHDARTERGYIAAESEVVVVNGDNLGLVVRLVDPGQAVTLPDHGREVYGSFGARVAAESAREDTERARWESSRRRYGFIMGGLLGAVAAGLGVALLWGLIVERAGAPWAVAAAAVVCGAGLGVCLFRWLDAALREVGGDYWRFTTASAGLGLAGGTTGAVWAVPSVGLAWGAAIAVVATVVLAAVAPVVGMLIEWVTGSDT